MRARSFIAAFVGVAALLLALGSPPRALVAAREGAATASEGPAKALARVARPDVRLVRALERSPAWPDGARLVKGLPPGAPLPPLFLAAAALALPDRPAVTTAARPYARTSRGPPRA